MHPLALAVLILVGLIAYFNLGWVYLYYSFNKTPENSNASKFIAGPGEIFRPGTIKHSFMQGELYDEADSNYLPTKIAIAALFPAILLVVAMAWLVFIICGGIAKQFFNKATINDVPRRY
jgi:hypothetical protein